MSAATAPRELPEKLFRCECGAEVLGVSFYTWKDDPPDWFIEVYKMPGEPSWRWRFKQMWKLLRGHEITVDAVALDPPKVEKLMAFLAASIAEVEGVQSVTVGETIWTWTAVPK